MEANAGRHNADLEAARKRLEGGASYRDLSTVGVLPTKTGKLDIKVQESLDCLIKPMNQQFYLLRVKGYEVGDAYYAAISTFLSHPQLSKYVFLLTVVGEGYGGLEHRASAALLASRADLPYRGMKATTEDYRRFLGLVSHEYFHSWNVKRIKPAAFVPYDLDPVRSLDIAPFAYPERDRIEAVQGDIRDRGAVDRAMAGVDVVFHCAAALRLYGPDDITSSIAGGTRTVLESAVEHGVPRVVYISSTAVYGIPDHHPLREEDRLQGVGRYGKAKIQAEQLCRAFRDRGLCVPILRAKTFVGTERLGVFAILYEWASEGRNFPMIGSGANRYQLLDVEDLCEASYLCATLDATSVNHTCSVGADQFTTFREDVQAVLDCAGHGKRMIAFR